LKQDFSYSKKSPNLRALSTKKVGEAKEAGPLKSNKNLSIQVLNLVRVR